MMKGVLQNQHIQKWVLKQLYVLTESGSLGCSKKAENSTSLNLGPAIDLPCHGGRAISLEMEDGSLESNPQPGAKGFTLKEEKDKK